MPKGPRERRGRARMAHPSVGLDVEHGMVEHSSGLVEEVPLPLCTANGPLPYVQAVLADAVYLCVGVAVQLFPQTLKIGLPAIQVWQILLYSRGPRSVSLILEGPLNLAALPGICCQIAVIQRSRKTAYMDSGTFGSTRG